MEFAVTLYFNNAAEESINKFIYEIAKNNGNKYMVDNKILPHLTISFFEYNGNINSIINLLDRNISKLNIGNKNISFATFGVFNPNVLFIAPIVNKMLLELNENLNNILKENNEIILNKYYSKDFWVPHVSLGVKLSKEELQNGINILVNNFQYINAEINKIALEECNPLKNIKIWELKNGL